MGLLNVLSGLPAIPSIPAVPNVSEIIGNATAGLTPESIIATITSYAKSLLAKVISMIPDALKGFYNTHKVLCILAAICLLVLIAYEGYRFFKAVTYAGGAFAFGLVGLWYLAPMVETQVKSMIPIPAWIDYNVAIAVACAIIGLLLCHFAFNFVLLGGGGVAGYILGSGLVYTFVTNKFHTLTFLQNDTVKKALGVIVAILGAILVSALFKLVFKFLTAFGGMVGASVLLQTILVPVADEKVRYAFIGLGVVLAIVALIRQHNEEDRTLVFRF